MVSDVVNLHHYNKASEMLFEAATNGDAQTLQLLVQCGVDLDTRRGSTLARCKLDLDTRCKLDPSLKAPLGFKDST